MSRPISFDEALDALSSVLREHGRCQELDATAADPVPAGHPHIPFNS